MEGYMRKRSEDWWDIQANGQISTYVQTHLVRKRKVRATGRIVKTIYIAYVCAWIWFLSYQHMDHIMGWPCVLVFRDMFCVVGPSVPTIVRKSKIVPFFTCEGEEKLSTWILEKGNVDDDGNIKCWTVETAHRYCPTVVTAIKYCADLL